MISSNAQRELHVTLYYRTYNAPGDMQRFCYEEYLTHTQGPVLRVRPGDRLVLTLVNQLPSAWNGTTLIGVAAHPGYAATSLTHNGPGGGGRRRFMDGLTRVGDKLLAQSAAAGARPQIHAATSPDVVGNDYFGPDGLMEQRGNGVKRVGRTGRAADPEAAKRLWAISEEMTGVVYPWPDRT